MNKIVYNDCYGGFSLSEEAVLLARKISGNPKWGDCTLFGESFSDGSINDSKFGERPNYPIYPNNLERHDPVLVEVVETLGSEKASGFCAELAIFETSSNQYKIDEYDGRETVETPNTLDWITIK